jgi:hypothetical protein
MPHYLRVVAGAVAEEDPDPVPRRYFCRRTERVAAAHGNIHFLTGLQEYGENRLSNKNPKLEIRNSKSSNKRKTIVEVEERGMAGAFPSTPDSRSLLISALSLHVCFGFRYSDFGFS